MRAVIHRARGTPRGDFHTHWCEGEGCDEEMGTSGAEPFVVLTGEDNAPGKTLCLSCAEQQGVTEWVLDPETTFFGDTAEVILKCPWFGLGR